MSDPLSRDQPAAEPPTWTADDAGRSLRAPVDDDDKYSRGVVGMRTGSVEFPGAAVLGVEAAWRTGTGMVRYLGPERASTLVLQRRPETVTSDGRVQAWVIGSGSDASTRPDEETTALRSILNSDLPVVVDAGALDLAVHASAPLVVTPHATEHDRLRQMLGLSPASRDARVDSVLETAATLGGAVLLKGSRTVVATPAGWCVVVAEGTPWLATAGTGDVLGGVVGALVAGAGRPLGVEDLGPLAATAAWLHGRAARRAAAERGQDGGPITALDVAEALPHIVGELLPRVVARELQRD